MEPTIRHGDWLFIDPTTIRWPRRGSIVLFREPNRGELAVKRIAAGPGERVPFGEGYIELAHDEAWLLSDASPQETAAAGYGGPIDSRMFGPVPVELLVGRAWLRYGPWRRFGRLRPPPAPPA